MSQTKLELVRQYIETEDTRFFLGEDRLSPKEVFEMCCDFISESTDLLFCEHPHEYFESNFYDRDPDEAGIISNLAVLIQGFYYYLITRGFGQQEMMRYYSCVCEYWAQKFKDLHFNDGKTAGLTHSWIN